MRRVVNEGGRALSDINLLERTKAIVLEVSESLYNTMHKIRRGKTLCGKQAYRFSRIDTMPTCDRQTDRQTDRYVAMHMRRVVN